MKNKNMISLIAVIGILIGTAGTGFAFGGFGSDVNTACAPVSPYSGSDCLLCHAPDSKSTPTPARDAYNAGGSTLTDFFCPSAAPACTDSDGDGYATEGGDCGAIDCNDNDIAVNPGASEICTDGFDNDCDNLIDEADPNAVGCPVPDLDNDGDGFTVTEGDCDDTEAAINPDAVELCTDGIDNNCNGLVDTQDPDGVGCPISCTDDDGDTYAVEGGVCGQIDCDDSDPFINPGAEESCGDSTDNDCDELVDEGCGTTCLDEDGDGYKDVACGGNDCDDTNFFINPGVAEVCGDGVDGNCNGFSDESCLTCPDGTVLIVKEMEYNRGDAKLSIKGRANNLTTITIIDADTGKIIADDIKVEEGKWKVKIKDLDDPLETIRFLTGEGCYLDSIIWQNKDKNDKKAEDDDDDKDDKKKKKKKKSKKHKRGEKGREK